MRLTARCAAEESASDVQGTTFSANLQYSDSGLVATQMKTFRFCSMGSLIQAHVFDL